ncbi:MAG TPA: 3-methyl-2-oxobutanoate hydroxymethyltransferase, partial [Candidatus Thioglobus sp.]|nr:3-methyl-2-oxobutanoate hydroxymethyltransferase [Candidatus Thioglobus sp.]
MKHSELSLFKESGEKITCLTAYDASIAGLIDSAGVDVVLIGDSLGMVIQGGSNTRSVTMKDMLYHTSIVSKACQSALVIADMPFESYENTELALTNAKQLVSVGADMVKIEGGREHE